VPNSLWVAQKYLERPLLYKERKFDIRLWALVTSNFDIYYYKNSYVRTSSSKYELSSTQDYLTHLTNNCFQVLSDTYGAHEEGNIISLKDLEAYIRAVKEPSYSLEEHFFPWAVSHCVDVFLAGQKKMKRVPTSYELFGFDLMIDEDLRVWLIECNVNPHLGTPNELMKKVVPEMLNEMLTIVLDPLIAPKVVPSKYETGHWILAYNTSMKNKDHILTKTFYPVKAFAISRAILISQGDRKPRMGEEELMDMRRKKLPDSEEFTIDDKLLRKNVTLRLNNATFNTIDGKKYKAYSIDNIKELIFKQIGSISTDEFQLGKAIDRVFACMANWELYSDEQIRSVIKAIRYVLDTHFDYLICAESNIKIMINMLKAEELKFDLMIELVDIFCKMLQKKKMRIKFSNCVLELVDLFSRAMFFLIKGEDSQVYPKALVSKLSTAIINLCEEKDRSIYVPGETSGQELVILQALLSGGFIALICVKQILQDESLSSLVDQFFESTLEYDDLSLQKDILNRQAEVFQRSGLFDAEKMVKFDSCKVMPKRLFKILERALTQVNNQIANLFSDYDPNCPQPSKKELEREPGSPKKPSQEKEAKDMQEEPSSNRLFYFEWLEVTSKDVVMREVDELLERKHEDRMKAKAKEQKKAELYPCVTQRPEARAGEEGERGADEARQARDDRAEPGRDQPQARQAQARVDLAGKPRRGTEG